MRIVDRVAYINHDIDDAIRYGILAEAELPRDGDRSARLDRLGAHRPPRPRPRGDLERGRRHRPERGDRRGDALAARVHVRSRLPRPARRAGAPAGARASCAAIFARLVDDPELLPLGEGELADRITDYVSGMTDRFALAYAGAL